MTFAGPQRVSAPDRPVIMPARSHVLNAMLPESSTERTWRALSLVAGILQAGVGLPVPLVVR